MKGFLKFLLSVLALFSAAVGALAVYDAVKNKNRIKGEYLECDSTDEI